MAHQLTRRTFLRRSLAASLSLAAGASAGVGYAFVLEPDWLAVEKIAVQLPKAPESAATPVARALHGLRVAHISDLHCGPFTSARDVRAAVEAVNALEPDLIVLTGDYVLGSACHAAPCAQELAALWAPLGVFAIPGNHDYWTEIDEVTAQLHAAGLTVLRNQSVRIEWGGALFWLAGLDDIWERHHDLPTTLNGVPVDEPVLLLAHEPDFADEAAQAPHNIVLQLSGHSHGGQVNLPLLGRPILPWLGQKYPAGLQSVPGSDLQVYTSRGVGVISPPLRFNCRPQVTLLSLLG